MKPCPLLTRVLTLLVVLTMITTRIFVNAFVVAPLEITWMVLAAEQTTVNNIEPLVAQQQHPQPEQAQAEFPLFGLRKMESREQE
jgi:hypothetical protein